MEDIMGLYYDCIMGDASTDFLSMFEHKWKEELSFHKLPYCNASQILVGNRLRPIILAWGYYINTKSINHEFILDYAICIELIHKASILLDDLIDNDKKRHGLKTFHIEYSQAETILYAIFLINRSITIMHQKDMEKNSFYTSMLLKTINNMSIGGIKEICIESLLNIQDVTDIINLETTSLIENSFLLGYMLSDKTNGSIMEEVFNIGHLCGYCFQVLNDIEPFLAPDINQKYKGFTNNDFSRNRKNIVIAYLYGACSQYERKRIVNNNFENINNLISKYKIIDLILDDINFKMDSIKKSAISLYNTNLTYYSDFIQFLNNMFRICFQKCGLSFDNYFLNDR